MEFDLSWMQEKNGPDGMSNCDVELYKPRKITNKYISVMTKYVDDANRYFLSKKSSVWFHWSFCPGFDEDTNKHGYYFNVWGKANALYPRKVSDAKFVFNGTCDMFRHFCTKENLDEMGKKILGDKT